MAKSIIEYISEEDYPRYQELIALAEEAKKNAPRAPRKPMSKEAQVNALRTKMAKAQAALEALLAQQA